MTHCRADWGLCGFGIRCCISNSLGWWGVVWCGGDELSCAWAVFMDMISVVDVRFIAF